VDLGRTRLDTAPRTGCQGTSRRHQVVDEENRGSIQVAPDSKYRGGKRFAAGPAQPFDRRPGAPPAVQERPDRDPRGSRQRSSDLQARSESTGPRVPRVRGNGDDTTRAERLLAEHGEQHPSHRVEQLPSPPELRAQQVSARQSGVANGRHDCGTVRGRPRHFGLGVQAQPAAMTGTQGLPRTQPFPAGEATRGQRGIEQQPGQRVAAQTARSDEVRQREFGYCRRRGTEVNRASYRSGPVRGRVPPAGSPRDSSPRRCSTRRTRGSDWSRPSGFRRTGGSRTPTAPDPFP